MSGVDETIGSSSWADVSLDYFESGLGSVFASNATLSLPKNFEEIFGPLGPALRTILETGHFSVEVSKDSSTKIENKTAPLWAAMKSASDLEKELAKHSVGMQAAIVWVWNAMRCIVPSKGKVICGMLDKVLLEDRKENGARGQRYGSRTFLSAGLKNPGIPKDVRIICDADVVTAEDVTRAKGYFGQVFGMGTGSELIHDAIVEFLRDQGEHSEPGLYWSIACKWRKSVVSFTNGLHPNKRGGTHEVLSGTVPDKLLVKENGHAPRAQKKGHVVAYKLVRDTPGIPKSLGSGSDFYLEDEKNELKQLEQAAHLTLGSEEAAEIDLCPIDRDKVIKIRREFDKERKSREAMMRPLFEKLSQRKDEIIKEIGDAKVARGSKDFSDMFKEICGVKKPDYPSLAEDIANVRRQLKDRVTFWKETIGYI